MQYEIQDIEIGVPKNITGKDGKPYQLLPLSLKIEGIWRKGALFGKEMIMADELSVGDMIELELSEKAYTNKDGEEKTENRFKITGMSQ